MGLFRRCPVSCQGNLQTCPPLHFTASSGLLVLAAADPGRGLRANQALSFMPVDHNQRA